MALSKADQDSWKVVQVSTGICLAVATLFVGIHLVEQIFAREPWTFQRITDVGLFSIALFYVPFNWFTLRREFRRLQRISVAGFELTSDLDVKKRLRRSIVTILGISSIGLLLLVMAFHDILKR